MSRSKSLIVFITLVAAVTSAATVVPAMAEDCTEVAREQIGDLAAFSKMAGMNNCATADGRAIYQRNTALLKVLNERNGRLAAICPTSDARWEYARKTLEIQARIFSRISKDCGG